MARSRYNLPQWHSFKLTIISRMSRICSARIGPSGGLDSHDLTGKSYAVNAQTPNRKRPRTQRDGLSGDGSSGKQKGDLLKSCGCYVVIAVAAWLAYSNTFSAPFAFDDHRNIEQNAYMHVTQWDLSAFWDAAIKSPTPRPIANLSFALNHYLHGLRLQGYHYVNLAIHVLCGVLVFLLVRFAAPRLVPQCQSRVADGMGLPLLAALLFVTHPVQTQAVTYIVQRMASLCALFYLLGLWTFFQGRIAATSKLRWIWWGITLLSWLLALGSKQFAVTLPLAILLCEWFLFREARRDWLLPIIKYFLGILALMLVVALVFKGADLPKLFTRGYTKRDFTLLERVLTEFRIVVHYLTLIVLPLPSRLNLIYDYPLSTGLFAPVTTILSGGFLLGLIGWALFYAQRYRVVCFCVLWFFLHMAVESTVIPLELVYEHRLYLPMFGICLGSAYLLFCYARTEVVGWAIGGALCMALVIGTYNRNKTWGDLLVLWTDNVAKAPTAARAHFNLAVELVKRGKAEEAVEPLSLAIEHEPRFQQAYVRRAAVYDRQGKAELALADLDRALEIQRPDIRFGVLYPEAYHQRGAIHLEAGRFAQAVDDLTQAIELSADPYRSLLFRATAYSKLSQPRKVMADFESALDWNPASFEVNNNLAWLLATSSQPDILDGPRAVIHATKACELTQWKHPAALSTLAAAYARAGKFADAVRWQEKATALETGAQREKFQQRRTLYADQKALTVP